MTPMSELQLRCTLIKQNKERSTMLIEYSPCEGSQIIAVRIEDRVECKKAGSKQKYQEKKSEEKDSDSCWSKKKDAAIAFFTRSQTQSIKSKPHEDCLDFKFILILLFYFYCTMQSELNSQKCAQIIGQTDNNNYLQQQKMQPVQRDSSSIYRRKNQQKLLNFLKTQFGFSDTLANLIIVVHECSDQAELMTLFVLDDDHKYGHIFVPNQADLSAARCQVCEQGRNLHINEVTWQELIKFEQELQNQSQNSQQEQKLFSHSFSNQQSESLPGMNEIEQQFNELIEQKKSKIKFSESTEFNYKTCCICYGNFRDDDLVYIGEVLHEVCLTCMGEYLKEQILNLRIENIACPHCADPIGPDIIKQYVNKALFEKYQTFSRNLQIQKNPNFKWCPNPKCSVVISVNKKKSTAKCPKCETLVCTQCNGVAHPKQSCDEVIRNIYKDLQNASDIQKCKKCKALVQKIAGCNHMTCGVCRYQWCWLCGATYSDIHFSPLNPLGCAGMQNRNISGFAKCKIYFLRILMIIGFIIFLPVVLPLVMVFCGPVLLYNFLVKRVCRYYGCCFHIVMAFISLPFGIAIDPVVWIGAIIYFIPAICRAISNWFERRRNMNESSQNQIKRRLLEDKQAEVVVGQS